MTETAGEKALELPNIVTILAEKVKGTPLADFLLTWQSMIFSLIIIILLSAIAYAASRRIKQVPGRLQAACELFVGGVDDFVRGIIGDKARIYTPFIGTLFIYILFMNLSGIVPLMKSPTSNWSTTMALTICVMLYVFYVSIKEMGFIGYIDHLLGKPRGIIAFSVFIPLMMLVLHIVSDFIARPLSLSLRLRSNIWGDDMLLAVLSGFGVKGIPLLLFNTFQVILASIVQTVVFCLLTTIYFTLVLTHEET
jgi:F-type H+-transporting ATPase subunit a